MGTSVQRRSDRLDAISGPLGLFGSDQLKQRKHGPNAPVWLFLLLIAGLGGPSFTIPRLQDWWWAMAAILLQSHEVCSAKMGGRPYL